MPSILITGARQGLGLGLAAAYHQRGWEVTATIMPGIDPAPLVDCGAGDPDRMFVAEIDVTASEAIEPFLAGLGDRRYDVVFSNAGIWGRLDQDLNLATDDELAEVMLTNCFGPVRLARRLIDRLNTPGGTLTFMSSHRASIECNDFGEMDLYRPSKVALNMLAKSTWVANRDRDMTVLLIHPGWVATEMGTLGGTVEAEISLDESVDGIVSVVDRHRGSGELMFRDWQDQHWPW